MNVGIDIAEIERFTGANIGGAFSAAEMEYIRGKPNKAETMAGLFCAKEAYFKAAGTGILKSRLPSVEIAYDGGGRPFYKNDPNALLSISHTKTTAVAVCIKL
jgi:phosphopantetheine--protein transferase-like protein